MEKKYEILKDTKIKFLGREVYRIRALKDFSDVKKGDIGGSVENEDNLSQEGDCWIYDNAVACGNSIVSGNSEIKDYAVVCGNAVVKDYAIVKDYAVVGHAIVCGYGVVGGDSKVCDKLTN